jgi:hypothetical protein
VTKIKLNISVLGQDFDVEAYQREYKDVDHSGIKLTIVPPIVSKIPGTLGPYSQWSSKTEFITLKSFDEKYFASGWLEEEALILDYLEGMTGRLADISMYFNGDHSKILTAVYLESEDRPVGGFFFSHKFYEKLASMSLFMELICRKDHQ